jgi:hypothetical protein
MVLIISVVSLFLFSFFSGIFEGKIVMGRALVEASDLKPLALQAPVFKL